MNELIFNVLMALVVAIAGIIAKSLIPYLHERKEAVTAELRQTKWAWAAEIIDAVVRAVEQTVSKEIHGNGKKEIAVRCIKEILSQNGIEITDEQIDALIEAAVHSLNEGIEITNLDAIGYEGDIAEEAGSEA